MLSALAVASAAFAPQALVGRAAAPAGMARVQMMATNVDGVRIGPPPDLPSLLLHNRIVYVGTGLVPAVAELIVAQLLYLQVGARAGRDSLIWCRAARAAPPCAARSCARARAARRAAPRRAPSVQQFQAGDKHYYMYINTPGTASQDGMTGFETDAFAIADTMRYIRPEAHTICLGMAYGTGAMLLASGAKGKRAMLPNAVAMLHQPRSRTQGQASDISLRAKEVLFNRRVLASLIAERSGQTLDKVELDMGRTKYLSADECLAYGLVDNVMNNAAVRRAASLARGRRGCCCEGADARALTRSTARRSFARPPCHAQDLPAVPTFLNKL
jgi:ATP-dependent Clp protease protease subunit